MTAPDRLIEMPGTLKAWGKTRIYQLILFLRTIFSNVLLALYVVFHRRPPDNVRSVLHVSLISHKQFMISRRLRELGIKSAYFALNTSENDRLFIGYDYNIPMRTRAPLRRILEFYYLWFVFSRFDVIHYHFNAFLALEDGWELEYLKRMGKVIVFHFRGCDLRSRTLNVQLNPELNLCQECDYPVGSCDTPYQRERLQRVRDFGDLFFATTPDLLPFFDGAEHIPFIAITGIDFDSIQAAEKPSGVFRVVTSSNHPGLDGVPYIIAAVEKLRTEGHDIELVEIFQRPYLEALSIYKSADLYAGKLRMGYYNNANIETMMMGVPNMSYLRDDLLGDISDCPIIVARPDDIYEKIREWIAKPQELKQIGMKGPAFVKHHHDPDTIVRNMVARYNKVLADRKAEEHA